MGRGEERESGKRKEEDGEEVEGMVDRWNERKGGEENFQTVTSARCFIQL